MKTVDFINALVSNGFAVAAGLSDRARKFVRNALTDAAGRIGPALPEIPCSAEEAAGPGCRVSELASALWPGDLGDPGDGDRCCAFVELLQDALASELKKARGKKRSLPGRLAVAFMTVTEYLRTLAMAAEGNRPVPVYRPYGPGDFNTAPVILKAVDRETGAKVVLRLLSDPEGGVAYRARPDRNGKIPAETYGAEECFNRFMTLSGMPVGARIKEEKGDGYDKEETV